MVFAHPMLAELSFENISNVHGVGIAVTGMLIVFSALILITIFIAGLPKLLAALEGVLGPEVERHGGHGQPGEAAAAEQVVAAIGFALHLKESGKQ